MAGDGWDQFRQHIWRIRVTHQHSLKLLLLISCLLDAGFVGAESTAPLPISQVKPPQREQATPAAALALGQIRVAGPSAGPISSAEISSSVDMLAADSLQQAHVDFSWELFRRAPGIQVTAFNQGTDAGRFSFRGFNGEGRINAVKLLIDGVPSNDNAGGMPFLDAVFPLDIADIEIVRGTNDPRYGLNNIAGNVNLHTVVGAQPTQVMLSLGSFASREFEIAKGFERGHWTQNYFFAWRDSSGYRQHATARKWAAAGKWFYRNDDDTWRAGLIARAYQNHALESGYLSLQQAQSTPRQSPLYAANDHGQRSLGQLSLQLEHSFSPTLAWTNQAYLNDYSNQRWVRFSAATSQQERDNDEIQRGVSSVLTWRPRQQWLGGSVIEAGFDAQWQHNFSQRYRTVASQRYSQFRDWAFNLATQGAYLQAQWQLSRHLQLSTGLRLDQLTGGFNDRLALRAYGLNPYGLIKQPKLSALYRLGPLLNLYANWGRSFQVGTGLDAYRTQLRALRPSINDGWEAGLKLQPHHGWSMRVAYWQQRASGEVATRLGVNGQPDPSGLANLGQTLRAGYDLQLDINLADRLTAWAAYSRQRAVVARPTPGAALSRGRAIQNVPNYLATAGMDWQLRPRLKLMLSVQGQGSYALDLSQPLGRIGQYLLLNIGASYQLNRHLGFSLQLSNLANRENLYGWYDSGTAGYAPGDGRAISSALTIEL